jgi:hypothetical protein
LITNTNSSENKNCAEKPGTVFDSQNEMTDGKDSNVSLGCQREYAKMAMNVILAGAEGVYSYGLYEVWPSMTPRNVGVGIGGDIFRIRI